MARSGRIDVDGLFSLLVRTGLGVRLAARHLQINEDTACSAVSRERRENPEGSRTPEGRLAGYEKRKGATCGDPGCGLCAGAA